MPAIDLRSDTITLPSAAMREAMARAPVGDDQYGEDPSVNRLQEKVAEILGKEVALFVPSGTMANQIALKVFTRPGDDVIVGKQSHAVFHETGASAANSGVQFTEVGERGLFTADEFRAAYKAPGHMVYPPTTLVEVENTHNRSGGLIFPADEAERICETARSLRVASYLDGARLFNVAVATGISAARLARPFDMASISLSKGLGAPVGSVVVGRKSDIEAAIRYRRMLGGAMRQCGVLAAAGLYALEHNIERLAEDHANARILAERLADCPGVEIDLAGTKTNIVVFKLTSPKANAAQVVSQCRSEGVLLLAFSERVIRAVTHLDVDANACRRAADVLTRVISSI
jgi:threonine aldolase